MNVGTYIFPPRPKHAVLRKDTSLFSDLGWVAQLKFNDTRVVIKLTSEGVEFWNRHGERVKNYFPSDDVLGQLEVFRPLCGSSWCLLDGGVLDTKHTAIRDTIVVWDVLVSDGEALVGSRYGDRYNRVVGFAGGDGWLFDNGSMVFDFGLRVSDNIFIPRCFESVDWDGLWDVVASCNSEYAQPLLEGLVFKDLGGVLEFGLKPDNNTCWLAKSRVCTKRHRF